MSVDPVQQAREIAEQIKRDIKRLDTSKLCLAVAQDVAGRIRKNISGNQVKPPIKPTTVERKRKDPATAPGAAGVTLMHTGLMHDNIRARQAGMNKAEVVVEPKQYGLYARVSSIKTKAERWMKRRKADQAKRSAGKASRPTTEQVARWHNEGEARNSPKREFFKLPEDIGEIIAKRFVKWRDAAVKAVLGK